MESGAKLIGDFFMVRFFDSHHQIKLFNSSFRSLFSVKVVLICSEALGLVKDGFTNGKLKVQNFSSRVHFAHTTNHSFFRYQQQQRI